MTYESKVHYMAHDHVREVVCGYSAAKVQGSTDRKDVNCTRCLRYLGVITGDVGRPGKRMSTKRRYQGGKKTPF